MTTPRVLVLVSDLHAGSRVALMPEQFEDSDGGIHRPSTLQRWLLDAWTDALRSFLPTTLNGDACELVIVGDCVEGVHHGGGQLVTNEPSDHGMMAAKLLLDLQSACKPQRTWMVEGTECHVRKAERSIALELGAETNPITGWPVFEHLRLNFCGTLCSIAHHISATSRPYLESTQYSIAMGVERVECARAGWGVPKVFARAHRHRFGYYSDGQGLLMVTGPWQALTRHGHKVVTGAIPMPSMQVLDWRGVPDGGIPVVRFQAYAMPEPQTQGVLV